MNTVAKGFTNQKEIKQDTDLEKDIISFEKLPNGSIKLFGIPDGDNFIDVVLRPLKRKDRLTIQAIEETDPEANEKLLSVIISQWGDREHISSQELLEDSKEDAVLLLMQAFAKFFQKEYSFRSRY